MRNAHYVLLDDRSVVEHFRDVVAGGADQFHPAIERLLVRLAADKRGQKRMMNIDDVVRRIVADEVRR